MLTRFHPLRVAVLSSHRCPGAAELLANRSRGWRWKLVCALANEEDFADRGLFESAGVPVVTHPIRPFYRSRRGRLADRELRREYDEQLVALLSRFRPDLLLLSSYLYVVTAPLIDSVGGAVVNIHGSDLTRRGVDGHPRYLGLRAVADAILAGETETRATAHWVTEEVDLGPPILRSRPFPVAPLVRPLLDRDRNAVKAYARAHQEWMLREAWGRLWNAVVRLVVSGLAPPARSGAIAEPSGWSDPRSSLASSNPREVRG